MKIKAATISENGEGATEFSAFMRASLRELTTLHRANKVADAEIRRLQISTRKTLDRIRENLGHVQATN
jgi:hypothetical protein